MKRRNVLVILLICTVTCMYIPVDVIAAAKTKLAPVYYTKNIKTQKDQYGKDFFSNQGAPGINIGLAKSEAITQKYEISVTATFGCDKDKILSATWGTTKAKTLTYSGTYKVPAKHNGKKVYRGMIHMRPIYKVKTYTIYKQLGGGPLKKVGQGTSKRAFSVDTYVTFKYK